MVCLRREEGRNDPDNEGEGRATAAEDFFWGGAGLAGETAM